MYSLQTELKKMNRKTINIRIAGLGGMGVLTSSRILAEVAFRSGADVKKAEVHGMSQRGGSLCSDIRFGEKVHSPMIPAGEIDYLLLLQDDQLDLYRDDCGPETVLIQAETIDLNALPKRKTLNIAMLGLLSRYLDLPVADWMDAVAEVVPDRFHEMNKTAFEIGRRSGETG